MEWSRELEESYKRVQDIKNDHRDCTSCGCPITQKDFDDYKMCSWCYSQNPTSAWGDASTMITME